MEFSPEIRRATPPRRSFRASRDRDSDTIAALIASSPDGFGGSARAGASKGTRPPARGGGRAPSSPPLTNPPPHRAAPKPARATVPGRFGTSPIDALTGMAGGSALTIAVITGGGWGA